MASIIHLFLNNFITLIQNNSYASCKLLTEAIPNLTVSLKKPLWKAQITILWNLFVTKNQLNISIIVNKNNIMELKIKFISSWTFHKRHSRLRCGQIYTKQYINQSDINILQYVNIIIILCIGLRISPLQHSNMSKNQFKKLTS